MVNRIWQHHFGTGLVNTPGNFGKMGATPENQPLLDWLATEFVRTGWDIKAMHRLIMTSAVYRQQAGENGFPLRRIDAESIRDSILQIAGRLDTMRAFTRELVAAAPNLPDELGRAWLILSLEFSRHGLLGVAALLAAFVALGFGLEWLFWWATGSLRERMIATGLETVRERLRAVGLRSL